MGNINDYVRMTIELSKAQDVMGVLEAVAVTKSIPKICDNCRTGLTNYIKETKEQLKRLEESSGIALRVNDPKLLKYTNVEYTGPICVVIDKVPEEVAKILGISDCFEGFRTSPNNEIEEFFLGRKIPNSSVDIRGLDNKTLLFTDNMAVAQAYMLAYIKKS